jgi:hypothetical protein
MKQASVEPSGVGFARSTQPRANLSRHHLRLAISVSAFPSNKLYFLNLGEIHEIYATFNIPDEQGLTRDSLK